MKSPEQNPKIILPTPESLLARLENSEREYFLKVVEDIKDLYQKEKSYKYGKKSESMSDFFDDPGQDLLPCVIDALHFLISFRDIKIPMKYNFTKKFNISYFEAMINIKYGKSGILEIIDADKVRLEKIADKFTTN